MRATIILLLTFLLQISSAEEVVYEKSKFISFPFGYVTESLQTRKLKYYRSDSRLKIEGHIVTSIGINYLFKPKKAKSGILLVRPLKEIDYSGLNEEQKAERYFNYRLIDEVLNFDDGNISVNKVAELALKSVRQEWENWKTFAIKEEFKSSEFKKALSYMKTKPYPDKVVLIARNAVMQNRLSRK